MGKIARIISSKIEDDKIICKCEIYPDYNVQAQLYLPPGESSMPLPDDRTLLVEMEGSGIFIACGLWSTAQTVEKGEKLSFSRDANGNIKSSIYQKKDGKIVINADKEIDISGDKKLIIDMIEDVEIKSDGNLKLMEGTDFSCRYNELKSKLDDLKLALNNFISVYNSHTHTIPTGNSGQPSATGVSATTDFSNVKISNINVPGVGE